jgi:ankyrin repeat domain-containing protein 50
LVALQLDALSKLRAESKIRTAMEELPKTLDAFYDRILMEIEDDYEQAYLALQWLAFTPRPISLKELAEAVVIRPDEEPYLNEEDRFLDYKSLLEILPSGLVSAVHGARGTDDYILEVSDSEDADILGEREGEDLISVKEIIREDKNGDNWWSATGCRTKHEIAAMKTKIMVQFAHYSVKEYLESKRIGMGFATKYQINELSAHRTLAKGCFAYLLYVGSQNPEITRGLFQVYALLHYAANCWQYHMEKLEGQKIETHLAKLASDFLQCTSNT